jgi:acyl-CoA synthetase (AMP-forming)/AMP-acid ligase II
MPKTIAITPSWYWPANITRVAGVPPFTLEEHLVGRWARHRPDDVALMDDRMRITGRELSDAVSAAATGLRQRSAGGRVLFCSGPSAEGAVLLLALTAAGVATITVPPGDGASDLLATGATLAVGDELGAATLSGTGLPVVRLAEVSVAPEPAPAPGLGEPVIAIASGSDLAWHSNRSLLGAALSMGTFLGLDAHRPWLSTLALSSWDGMHALMVGLDAGAAMVLAEPGEPALDTITREGIGTSWWTLDSALGATRDAKRQVKNIRGVQQALMLSTPKLFDPDERRRVGKLFGSPALTFFGLPETGPIFASHLSWYIDESIGIPISNAFVVPVDPRSGNPIPTLWELVESAMVTVWCPGMMEGYEGDAHPERFRDGRFITGLIASSDANGMVYLLPD